jgi:hypothetical protein
VGRLKFKEPPKVEDVNPFNEYMRDLAEVVDTQVTGEGAVTTADAGGTYTSAEQTLLNELKETVNSIISNLKSAGVMET